MPNPPTRAGRAHINKRITKKGSPMYLVYAVATALAAGVITAVISGQIRKYVSHLMRSTKPNER